MPESSPPSISTPRRGRTRLPGPPLLTLLVIGFAGIITVGHRWPASLDATPELTSRASAIAALDVQRRGQLRVTRIFLGERPAEGEKRVVSYRLQSPRTRVEDTEIRGRLDGTVKHRFNQGVAFHVRLGRRYSGMDWGQFELKRGLFRWHLPESLRRGRVVGATAGFWVEGFFSNSPLVSAMAEGASPLHVYAYPLTADWGPGAGGVKKDTLSEAAPGEADWLEARATEKRWPAPGALARWETPGAGVDPVPLAVGSVTEGESELRLEGAGLAGFVEECRAEGRTLDLLVKLDDLDEDRVGTQFAVLTSEFGDDHDVPSRRPFLEVAVEFTGRPSVTVHDFVLESGMTRVFEVVRHPGATVLLEATTLPGADRDGDPGGRQGHRLAPEIRVRGGAAGESGETGRWEVLDNPVVRRWDWSQVAISSAVRGLRPGEKVTLRIREPWVIPGPRAAQVPVALFVAPSGTHHRARGVDVGDHFYEISFLPPEPGLWRYGWAFHGEPISAPFSHQGQGIFTVTTRAASLSAKMLRAQAQELFDSIQGQDHTNASEQFRINALIRRIAEYRLQGQEQQRVADEIFAELRTALPHQYQED